MQITNEQYDRIQDYLDGRMSENEKQQFIAETNTDEALKESLAFEKELREDLPDMREKNEIFALYNQMEADAAASTTTGKQQTPVIHIHAKKEKQAPRAKIFTMRSFTLAAAACVVLALVGLFFLLTPSKQVGNGLDKKLAGLYNQYFEKDTIPQKKYPLLAKAFDDYEKNDYTTLQQYDLQNLPNIKGVEDQKQTVLEFGYYYKGIAYLETNDFEKANSSFQWVIDNAVKEDLKWKANWYLGLSYIKNGHTDKALPLLQTLSLNDKAGEYKTKSAALLEKLNKTMAAPK